MRVLKMIGKLLLALVGLILVAGIFMSKRSESTYTVVIDAPKEVVWEQLRTLQNHQKWSPWVDHDPNMKVTYEGTDGNIGSKSSWVGDVVGVGEQTITAIEVMKNMKVALKFKKPWEANADATLIMTDQSSNGIKVDWIFGMDMTYPFNALAPIMGDGGMGNDFRNGLAKLKKICESQIESTKKYGFNIVEEQIPSTTYVGIRGKTAIPNAVGFYRQNIAKVASLFASKSQMAGGSAGLYFDWDEKANMADMAAVMSTTSAIGELDKPFESFSLLAGKYAVIDFLGPYTTKMGEAHTALGNYLIEKKSAQKAPVIELYLVAPANTPDSTKWHTRIMYPM